MTSHIPHFPGKDAVTSKLHLGKDSHAMGKIKDALHIGKKDSSRSGGSAAQTGTGEGTNAQRADAQRAHTATSDGAGVAGATAATAGGVAANPGRGANAPGAGSAGYDDFDRAGGGAGRSTGTAATRGPDPDYSSTGAATRGTGAEYHSAEAGGYEGGGTTGGGNVGSRDPTLGSGRGPSAVEAGQRGTNTGGTGTTGTYPSAGAGKDDDLYRGDTGHSGVGGDKYDERYLENTGRNAAAAGGVGSGGTGAGTAGTGHQSGSNNGNYKSGSSENARNTSGSYDKIVNKLDPRVDS